MRKKQKIYQSPMVRIEPVPKAFVASVSLSNIQEQKNRFLKHGKTPMFVVEGDTSAVEELAAKSSGRIRFDLLGEAEYILRTVKQQFGVGENYLEHIYGPRVDQDEANQILFDYIRENSLQESLSVYWSNEMTCSARMIWKGYSFKCNKPESRRYSLWLNGTAENPYLRQHGLRCLLDHEIGTHFYRSFNDGFQPWFYDRQRFGLRSVGSFESLCTEEGLAAINTTLRAKEKFLWLSALTYYTACKSTEMTFKQLFDHLGQFLQNPDQRWKHVMRVKRGLLDPNDLGGYGKDQCYFEGAVNILRNIDDINFILLMSGKVCYDEVSRIKRLARLGSIGLPAIMRDMEVYRKQLKEMAVVNGLHLSHPKYEPPRPYLLRLKERQAGVRKRRKVRKGRRLKASLSVTSSSGSEDSCSSIQSSDQSNQSKQSAKSDGSSPPRNKKKSDRDTVSEKPKATEPSLSAVKSDSGPSHRPTGKLLGCRANDRPVFSFAGDSSSKLDYWNPHAASDGQVTKFRVSLKDLQRPQTAGEVGKLPPLPTRRTGNTSGSTNFNWNAVVTDPAATVSLEEMCSTQDDCLSDDFDLNEDMEAWLANLSPPLSPSSEASFPSPPLPLIPAEDFVSAGTDHHAYDRAHIEHALLPFHKPKLVSDTLSCNGQ